ncbi:MAG: CDP-diacylglycerol--glycerol-3-phosphate 3-phosphatidyltransferase [Verrucomicrobiota bacterium]|jgi:cardiolipin synthase (CMP-forming)
MTTANKITICRILLIPVFIWLTLDYVRDSQHGEGHDWQRWLVCGVFALASISDAVDGYIARRYKQKTELGTYLDPLADKLLLVSALVLLSVRFKQESPFELLPLWFPVLVISRDLIILGGFILIHMITGHSQARPRLVGKAATVFQMITLGWILLQIHHPSFKWPLYAAGLCTFISGIWYILDGIKQLNAHEQKK